MQILNLRFDYDDFTDITSLRALLKSYIKPAISLRLEIYLNGKYKLIVSIDGLDKLYISGFNLSDRNQAIYWHSDAEIAKLSIIQKINEKNSTSIYGSRITFSKVLPEENIATVCSLVKQISKLETLNNFQ